MWLSRPVYELLPYAYMVLGLLLVGIGSLLERASIALLAGALLLIAGLVLWLKRRDYRRTRSEYNDHSLDE